MCLVSCALGVRVGTRQTLPSQSFAPTAVKCSCLALGLCRILIDALLILRRGCICTLWSMVLTASSLLLPGTWMLLLHQRRRNLGDHHVQLVNDAAPLVGGPCPFQFVLWWMQGVVQLVRFSLQSRRHDGGELDPTRLAFAGRRLSLQVALVQIKEDWAEFAHSLGFTAWTSRYHPCPLCFCLGEEMHGFGEVEAGSCPYPDKDCQAACGKCERRVMIHVSLHLGSPRCLTWMVPDSLRLSAGHACWR